MHLTKPYSAECVEAPFPELRAEGFLRSSHVSDSANFVPRGFSELAPSVPAHHKHGAVGMLDYRVRDAAHKRPA